MKHLFSIVLKDEKGNEVTEVIYANQYASDAGFLGVRRWLWQHWMLTSVSDQLVALQCSKGVVSDTLVVWRLTRDISIHWRWHQQRVEKAKVLNSFRR
jgi:hypothetical protein